MNQKEAQKQLKTMCLALNGLDNATVRRLVKKFHPAETDNGMWTLEHNGIIFRIQFGKSCVTVVPECEYIVRGGYRRFAAIPAAAGRGLEEYRFRLSLLNDMFPHKPFYLNHLTPKLLAAYSNKAEKETKEWSKWLIAGDKSESAWNSILGSTDEKTLHEFAPYMDELESLEDVLKLFETQ